MSAIYFAVYEAYNYKYIVNKGGFGMKKIINILLSVMIAVSLVTPVTVFAGNADTTVYITDTGECYHTGSCSCLRKSRHAVTLQSAVNSGYRACSKCDPPVLDSSSAAVITPAAATPAKSAVASQKETNKLVQQALNNLGYNCGKADGSFGKKSRAELKQFQTDYGLTATGKIDSATLTAL